VGNYFYNKNRRSATLNAYLRETAKAYRTDNYKKSDELLKQMQSTNETRKKYREKAEERLRHGNDRWGTSLEHLVSILQPKTPNSNFNYIPEPGTY
jgi:protein subunit release factor A